jgi:hypothetical protein
MKSESKNTMHSQTLTPPTDFAVSPDPAERLPVAGPSAELVLRIPFEIGLAAFGNAWALKTEILAGLETGTPSAYRLAKDYGVSVQYVARLAKRVKRIRQPGS